MTEGLAIVCGVSSEFSHYAKASFKLVDSYLCKWQGEQKDVTTGTTGGKGDKKHRYTYF